MCSTAIPPESLVPPANCSIARVTIHHASDTSFAIYSQQSTYERHLFIENHEKYGKEEYRDLWEVQRDITISAKSMENLQGALLSCYCVHTVYQGFSEARRDVEIVIFGKD